MEMQQMMEYLLAKMDANQAKTDSTLKVILAKTDANQEKMDAWVAEMGSWRKETMACQEAMEACLESKEPASLEVEFEAEHEEVHKEEATVKPVRALKKWHGDWNLAIRHCQKPKKRAHGNVGYRKKLAASCRGMTHRAIPVQHKGQGQDNVARGAPEGQTFGKRCWAKPEDITGIRNQGSRQEPHLGSRTILGRIFRKTVKLVILKQIVRTSIRLQKMSDWTLWRGQPPSKRKKQPLTTD
jgi:hypothetical protein